MKVYNWIDSFFNSFQKRRRNLIILVSLFWIWQYLWQILFFLRLFQVRNYDSLFLFRTDTVTPYLLYEMKKEIYKYAAIASLLVCTACSDSDNGGIPTPPDDGQRPTQEYAYTEVEYREWKSGGFRAWSTVDSKQTITMDVDALLTGINKTIFATADDELRPVMNGVYVNIEPQSVTFVATDAHKLVKYTAENASDMAASFILPKKPANLLRGMLPKEEEDVTIEFDDKNVLFRLKNQVLICRLIEGNYPNYNAVIPANNPNKVFVDRVELLNAIRRVAVCSNQSTNLIKFDIKQGEINLTAQDLDFSVSAQESLPCDYQGDDIVIGFKSTFLVEILSNLETPTMLIELADLTRAGVFKPVYDEQPANDTLMLLMPMMINA